MNYKIINTAILESKDVPQTIVKDRKFYRYLLDNNVAYYYAKFISREKGAFEKDIIQKSDRLNLTYRKTLKLIIALCKKHAFTFLLFKTYKHVPEVVDGDIDIFIKGKDFSNFLFLLKNEGFVCENEDGLKASCTKKGFCKIEPRVNITFQGKIILEENIIWKNTQAISLDKIVYKTTTAEIDLFFFLLNVLYGPNYFKLYFYLLLKRADPEKIFSFTKAPLIQADLRMLIDALTNENDIQKRFPLFVQNAMFLQWWLKRDRNIKRALFFVYAKYGYRFFNTLPFRHDWKCRYA